MAEKKNLCAQIDIDLHRKITEARERTGRPPLSTSQTYCSNILK